MLQTLVSLNVLRKQHAQYTKIVSFAFANALLMWPGNFPESINYVKMFPINQGKNDFWHLNPTRNYLGKPLSKASQDECY